MKKKWLIFISCFILVGVVIALVYRITLPSDVVTVEMFSNYTVSIQQESSYDEQYPLGIIGTNYNTFSEMDENSELIVDVKVSGERISTQDSIFTKVYVNRVYKGDKELEGTEVYVYEPFSFTRSYDHIFSYSYNLMQDDRNYILFLQSLESLQKFPEGYIKSDLEEKSYLLVNSIFSKYELTEANVELITDSNKNYSDVCDFEIITGSNTIRNNYITWKNSVYEKYIKSN